MTLLKVLKICLGVLIAACFVAVPLQGQVRYSFGGIIVSEMGQPMGNILVRAVPENSSGTLAMVSTRTDEAGAYRFENVPAGNYRIQTGEPQDNWATVRALKFLKFPPPDLIGFLSKFAPCGCVLDSIEPITAPYVLDAARISLDGNSSTRLDVAVLKSAFSVSGRVIAPAAIPTPPRHLSVSSVTSTVLTDVKIQDDGTFEIPMLPPGTFELRVVPNLGLRKAKITIEKQNLQNVEIGPDSAGVRITGNVPGSEKPGTQGKRPDFVIMAPKGVSEVGSNDMDVMMFGLGLVPTSGEPRYSIIDENGEVQDMPMAPVGSDGSFTFLSVTPGSYIFRTSPGGLGIPNTAIEIARGMNLDNVQVGISTRVRGEVVPLNSGNRPPEMITLTPAQGSAGLSVSAVIDEHGVFEFPKLGPGTYRVFVDGKPKAAQQQIEVGLDDRFLRIEAPFNSWITGRVNVSGLRMSAEELAAVHVTMTNGYDSRVESDGSFRIKSNDGEYEFFITNLPEECVVRSIAYGSDDVMNATFRVDASMAPREIIVTVDYKPASTLPVR